ncbi:collagen alpha-1(I) chain-like [Canis lupus familiaris]|uniref:collagen alpha-1(I) chain-like n=1 Tax=Canis lupus familiaris TaxID=9615 RepID=UPI0018F7D6CF|nr:collagen alpha-1(I) chain-like [Canis lupus familiaris]
MPPPRRAQTGRPRSPRAPPRAPGTCPAAGRPRPAANGRRWPRGGAPTERRPSPPSPSAALAFSRALPASSDRATSRLSRRILDADEAARRKTGVQNRSLDSPGSPEGGPGAGRVSWPVLPGQWDKVLLGALTEAVGRGEGPQQVRTLPVGAERPAQLGEEPSQAAPGRWHREVPPSAALGSPLWPREVPGREDDRRPPQAEPPWTQLAGRPSGLGAALGPRPPAAAETRQPDGWQLQKRAWPGGGRGAAQDRHRPPGVRWKPPQSLGPACPAVTVGSPPSAPVELSVSCFGATGSSGKARPGMEGRAQGKVALQPGGLGPLPPQPPCPERALQPGSQAPWGGRVVPRAFEGHLGCAPPRASSPRARGQEPREGPTGRGGTGPRRETEAGQHAAAGSLGRRLPPAARSRRRALAPAAPGAPRAAEADPGPARRARGDAERRAPEAAARLGPRSARRRPVSAPPAPRPDFLPRALCWRRRPGRGGGGERSRKRRPRGAGRGALAGCGGRGEFAGGPAAEPSAAARRKVVRDGEVPGGLCGPRPLRACSLRLSGGPGGAAHPAGGSCALSGGGGPGVPRARCNGRAGAPGGPGSPALRELSPRPHGGLWRQRKGPCERRQRLLSHPLNNNDASSPRGGGPGVRKPWETGTPSLRPCAPSAPRGCRAGLLRGR